jgi:hypothetical protein
MQQTEIFVPKSLAMGLKAKGYNEPCVGFFLDIDDDNSTQPLFCDKLISNSKMYSLDSCTAPTYDQVVGWFASKGIQIETELCTKDNTYITCVWKNNNVFFKWFFNSNRQTALLTAFEEALKLI